MKQEEGHTIAHSIFDNAIKMLSFGIHSQQHPVLLLILAKRFTQISGMYGLSV